MGHKNSLTEGDEKIAEIVHLYINEFSHIAYCSFHLL